MKHRGNRILRTGNFQIKEERGHVMAGEEKSERDETAIFNCSKGVRQKAALDYFNLSGTVQLE